MAKSRTPAAEPIRITTVGGNRSDDIATRQKRYLLSMSLRSLCFVGAVIAGLAGIGWLWPILIAGAIILPYFAVVLANVSTQRTDSFELRRTIDHRELGG
ncbi:DUF3099 domain-containing protein [Nocardioides sp. TRM66260-LWL]|uniref:DUF3099 domain-containing protein n=1 Tax=Nocardioides sp. TRM66260-LWL TaxID=2874478 RepID=UPI001CC7CED1|nr:DUF3099 domain-containing protein [Nocardioides sp. TRM66260-LWL]MBZ5733922.1 DUF3099 domain-containing protein [Nocardioides sp. TRM66260-LWL]